MPKLDSTFTLKCDKEFHKSLNRLAYKYEISGSMVIRSLVSIADEECE